MYGWMGCEHFIKLMATYLNTEIAGMVCKLGNGYCISVMHTTGRVFLLSKLLCWRLCQDGYGRKPIYEVARYLLKQGLLVSTALSRFMVVCPAAQRWVIPLISYIWVPGSKDAVIE